MNRVGLSGDLDLATSQSLHGRPLAPPTSKGIHSSRVLHLIFLTESLTGLELAGQRLGIHLSPPASQRWHFESAPPCMSGFFTWALGSPSLQGLLY